MAEMAAAGRSHEFLCSIYIDSGGHATGIWMRWIVSAVAASSEASMLQWPLQCFSWEMGESTLEPEEILPRGCECSSASVSKIINYSLAGGLISYCIMYYVAF